MGKSKKSDNDTKVKYNYFILQEAVEVDQTSDEEESEDEGVDVTPKKKTIRSDTFIRPECKLIKFPKKTKELKGGIRRQKYNKKGLRKTKRKCRAKALAGKKTGEGSTRRFKKPDDVSPAIIPPENLLEHLEGRHKLSEQYGFRVVNWEIVQGQVMRDYKREISHSLEHWNAALERLKTHGCYEKEDWKSILQKLGNAIQKKTGKNSEAKRMVCIREPLTRFEESKRLYRQNIPKPTPEVIVVDACVMCGIRVHGYSVRCPSCAK